MHLLSLSIKTKKGSCLFEKIEKSVFRTHHNLKTLFKWHYHQEGNF